MNCKNCKTSLNETSDYCYSCGGKVIRNRLTMRNLFAHFSETYLNIDNKFLQTFIDLFKKPEAVIDSYIDGTRKKYVDVISYFALAITITGLYVFIQRTFYPDAMDYSMFSPPGQQGQQEMQKEWISLLQDYTSILMMLYVPLYAILARITFLGIKKYNYTELLVVFMYVQGQLSISTSIITIFIMVFGGDMGLASFILLPLMIVYSAYCLKRLYNLSINKIILRTLIFLGILLVLYIIVAAVAIAIFYFTGGLDAFIEAQKAAQSS